MVEALKADVVFEKNRIVSYVKQTGPSVINNIAKSLNLNSFLAAALLSELANDKSLKASVMRVGGSPLYFVLGQEEQLEKFTNFLNHKEREAVNLIKKEGVLLDSELEPAIRVAIRYVKDFAIPLKVAHKGQETLFWRYMTFSDAESKIRDILIPKQEIIEQPKFFKEDKVLEIAASLPLPNEKEKIHEPKVKKEEKKEIVPHKSEFEKWAEANEIIIQEILFDKKKEIKSNVLVKSQVGELPFLLIFKDKKNLSEADLSLAYQEGLNAKKPVILLSKGKLSKQAQQYLEGMGNNLLYRKL